MSFKVSENEYAKFRLEENIVHLIYNHGVEITEEVAKKMVQDLSAFQQGYVYPYLIDLTGISVLTKEARSYLSTARTKLITKVAFLVRSHHSRMLGSFYLTVNKPVGTTEMFSNEEEAIRFLKLK